MQPSAPNNISPEFTRLVRRIARRVNTAAWLNRTLFPCAVVLAAFVVALLLAKLFAAHLIPYTLLLLIGVPLAGFHAHRTCLRKQCYFTNNEVIETIDHLYCDDGAVIAAVQSPELFPQHTLLRDAARAVRTHIPRIHPR